LTLLLTLVLFVAGCSPSDPHRMWRGVAYTDTPWEPGELYRSKDACEAAQRGLSESVQKTYATVCVPVGLTPKDIGRE